MVNNKKGNQLLAAILKYFLEVIIFCVYIFVKCRYFYVSGEDIVEKDARMCYAYLNTLYIHICISTTQIPGCDPCYPGILAFSTLHPYKWGYNFWNLRALTRGVVVETFTCRAIGPKIDPWHRQNRVLGT